MNRLDKGWLERYLESGRSKKIQEDLERKLGENMASLNRRRVHSGPHSGWLLIENRMLKKGQAFEIDRTIHVECIYPFIWMYGGTFEEKLDSSFQNARRNIAREIEAIMRKYTR